MGDPEFQPVLGHRDRHCHALARRRLDRAVSGVSGPLELDRAVGEVDELVTVLDSQSENVAVAEPLRLDDSNRRVDFLDVPVFGSWPAVAVE